MKIKSKKRGQKKGEELGRRVATSVNEFGERAGRHFSERFVGRIENVREVRLWVVEWALLVLVVFLLAITQNIWYSESFETEAFVKGGEYSEATLGKINSLNPLYATTSSEKTLAKLLFANLASPDATAHMKNELAKSITSDPTKQVWTVKLRDNLKWSDGKKITVDDVIYTINLISDDAAKTTLALDFNNVKMEKKDALTMTFTLPSAYTDFVDSLEFPIVPAHILGKIKPALVYESDFSKNPVGSGPFVFNALQSGSANSSNVQTVYLNRNENYFRSQAKLDSFTLKVYENKEDIVNAIKNADVTATAELAQSDADELPSSISRSNTLINGGAFAFLNTGSAKLKDVRTRQAIQQGVNIEKVRKDIDDSQTLDYPILARQEELKFPKIAEYNLENAQKLISSAGYKYDEKGKIHSRDGNIVVLEIAVPERDTLVAVAKRFAEQLGHLGFKTKLNIYDETKESADFFSAVIQPRQYDILIYEVDLGVSADPFVYYGSSQAGGVGWNFSDYDNSLVDDALVSARTATDKALRKTKYESFLQMWVRDVPAIGIYQSTMTYCHRQNIRIYSESSELTDAMGRFSEVQNWATRRAKVNTTP